MIFPKISIVTPSYNQGHYIEQTILSVLNQNYPNLEYIIIDGGSTDNTLEIIKKYESKISFWISEKDNGQSDAINKGINKCTGEIFNWLNSDDFLEPKSLFEIAKEYQKSPFTTLCGKVNVIDDTIFSHIRNSSYIGINIEDTIANFNINQEGTFWSLRTIKELNGVNIHFHYCMDLDLWIRALTLFPFETFRKSDGVFSNFRRHQNSKSNINSNSSLTNNNFIKEEFAIFNQFLPNNGLNLSCFTSFNINAPSPPIHLNYQLTNINKQTITELYLFKLLKKFYYSDELKLASKCLDLLVSTNNKLNSKDIRYFRKKIILKSFMFWK